MTITGRQIDVGQGWPLAEDLDAAVKAGRSIVSIYAVPGAGGRPPQIMDYNPGVITAAAVGLTLSVQDTQLTFSGSSLAGESIGVIVDGSKFYGHVSNNPETGAVVASAILSQVSADYALASVAGNVLTIPGSHSIVAKNGGTAVLGQKVHRQSTQFRIVVWSPNPADRTTIGRAIDVAVKQQLRFPMPDSSSAIITYEGTNLSDKEENAGIYRRDILVTALYDTIFEYQAKPILGVQTSVTPTP